MDPPAPTWREVSDSYNRGLSSFAILTFGGHMTTRAPDIFTNVHKGIRKALFDACTALGRAGDDPARGVAARALAKDALRFVTHHGENEDLLLLPLLVERAPAAFARMSEAHERVNPLLGSLTASIEAAPTDVLYERTCELMVLYLEHLREEEQVLEPAIRAALSLDELAGFGRRSVERTQPADQRMMLGFMLPAMTRPDVDAFLARLPPAQAEALRGLVTP
jgi:hypothetical protein